MAPLGLQGHAAPGQCLRTDQPSSPSWQTTAPKRARQLAVSRRATAPNSPGPTKQGTSTVPAPAAPDPAPAPSSPPASWNPLAKLFGGGDSQGAEQQGTMPLVPVSLSELSRTPLFRLLERLHREHGPIYRMQLGPRSFVVVSEPSYLRQILVTSVDRYNKGILSEILEFIMGQGLLSADGEHWMARRKAVAPALQRKFVASQVALFGAATSRGIPQLEAAAATHGSVEMEAFFSRLSLDVVGKSVFDYDFNALTNDDPVIQAVYTVLNEAAARSTAPFPFWKLPFATQLVPRLRKNEAAVATINSTLDRMVAKCKAMLESEGRIVVNTGGDSAAAGLGVLEDTGAAADSGEEACPSVLYFLIATSGSSGQAASDLISSKQLRDDLITLLVAGHETTAAALTWALHCLVQHPQAVAKVREEVDAVCGDALPTAEDLPLLRYTSRVISETLRLYPQPPQLFRRAEQEDQLGGVHVIPIGSDVILNVWDLHRNPAYWDDPEAFQPERFGPVEGPQPSESNTDFRFLPFGGGRRRCVGDQFAMAEAVVALAVLLRQYDFKPDPSKPPVGITTGATIHTTEGLHMLVTKRDLSGVPPPKSRGTAAAAASGCPHAAAAAAAAASAAAAGRCPFAAAAAAGGGVAGGPKAA